MACVKLAYLSQCYLLCQVLIFFNEVSSQFVVRNMEINSCSETNLIDVKDIEITVTENSVKFLSGIITLTEQLKSPIQADIKISKRGLILRKWIALPCVDKYFGSCHYEDLCQILGNLRENGINIQVDSDCIIPPTSVNLSGITVNIGSHLETYKDLIPGEYKALIKMYQDSNTVSCFEAIFAIKKS